MIGAQMGGMPMNGQMNMQIQQPMMGGMQQPMPMGATSHHQSSSSTTTTTQMM
jgi:hypothetical protein